MNTQTVLSELDATAKALREARAENARLREALRGMIDRSERPMKYEEATKILYAAYAAIGD